MFDMYHSGDIIRFGELERLYSFNTKTLRWE